MAEWFRWFGHQGERRRRNERRIEAGDVLDRISERMQSPIRGGLRLDLAKELDSSIAAIASTSSSRTVSAVLVDREARRIASILRVNSRAFLFVLSDELFNAADPTWTES